MLTLNSTSSVIRVVTGSAANVESYQAWVDHTSGAFTPGPTTQVAAVATATTTTIVSAPAASTQRSVGALSFYNVHASQSTTFEVEMFDGTTAVRLWFGTLLAGESVQLNEAGDWVYYDANGAVKLPTAKLDVRLYKTADQTFATAASFADITDLTTPLKSGKKYCFEAHLYHINNATTTGSQFAVNIGAAPTVLQVATIDTVTASVTASVHSAGATNARDTAVTAQTTGSVAITMGIVSGFIQPSADGTFAIRATSEVTVASGLIVKAGSWLRVWEVDN